MHCVVADLLSRVYEAVIAGGAVDSVTRYWKLKMGELPNRAVHIVDKSWRLRMLVIIIA